MDSPQIIGKYSLWYTGLAGYSALFFGRQDHVCRFLIKRNIHGHSTYNLNVDESPLIYTHNYRQSYQHLRTRRISRFMKIASILGTEEAYVVLLCFLLWIVDMRLGRLSSIAMAFGFYFANAIKNCLCLPRPPSPPVKPLEDAYYTWGLPSHHSVLAVVCPWYIWFYCLLHYNLEFTTFVCLFCLIVFWSSSVLICRIYNGVHSPADVVTGGLIGCIIVAVMNRFDNIMDLSSYMNGQAALLVPIICAIMLVLHPFNEVGLAAFKETNSMMSASVGFVLGRAASYGRSPPLRSVMEMYKYGESSLLTAVLVAVARVFIGVVIVVLTKVVLKKITQTLFELVLKMFDIKYYTKSKSSVFYTGYTKTYKLPPIYADKKKDDNDGDPEQQTESRLKSLLQQKEPINISHAIRFVTYIGMGFNGYYTTQVVSNYLGLVL